MYGNFMILLCMYNNDKWYKSKHKCLISHTRN
jgi:hypothetical protein